MKSKEASDKLQALITLVEARKKMEFLELKSEVRGLTEGLKPAHLLSSAFAEFSKPEIKGKLAGSVLSLAAGYLLRKVVVGKSSSPVRKILGYLVQWGATKIMTRKF